MSKECEHLQVHKVIRRWYCVDCNLEFVPKFRRSRKSIDDAKELARSMFFSMEGGGDVSGRDRK